MQELHLVYLLSNSVLELVELKAGAIRIYWRRKLVFREGVNKLHL
jgi:hypothetical protein